MIRPELKIFLDVQSLYAQAARDIENIAINSITSRGSAQIALSGGNTPKQLYAILDKSGRVPWDRVDFFLSDERMVPLTPLRFALAGRAAAPQRMGFQRARRRVGPTG